jgi:hypothetical protein
MLNVANADSCANPSANESENIYVVKPSWFDFDRGVRADILRRAHPPRTEEFEYTKFALHNEESWEQWTYHVYFDFIRQRKRITGTDLLEIKIAQVTVIRGVPTQTYAGTWHNITKIRLIAVEPRRMYNLEFVGNDADGLETTFRPPDWVNINYNLFHARAQHSFANLGLHKTRSPEVLEYRVE